MNGEREKVGEEVDQDSLSSSMLQRHAMPPKPKNQNAAFLIFQLGIISHIVHIVSQPSVCLSCSVLSTCPVLSFPKPWALLSQPLSPGSDCKSSQPSNVLS